jgi:hypothetical protein
MGRVTFGITGAVVLLLAGIFAWHTEATPLAEGISLKLDHSLVKKVGCDEADAKCPIGQEMWGSQPDQIQCVPCTHPPVNTACPAGKQPRYIHCATGWCGPFCF